MPKTFRYEVHCLPLDYDRYYVQFQINNPVVNASYLWNFGIGQPREGIKFSREFDVGEYQIELTQTLNGVAQVIETTTIFVVGIPGKKLSSGQKQLISLVDLYATTGLKQSISLPVKSLELGSAYAQNNSDYVNEFEEVWSVVTGFLSELQKDRLEATLQQLKGINPFSFVPQGLESAVVVVCESWSVNQLSNYVFQVSMEMTRYWERLPPSYGQDPILYNVVLQFNSRFPVSGLSTVNIRIWGRIGNLVSFDNDLSSAKIFWECQGVDPIDASPGEFKPYRIWSDSNYRINESNPQIQMIDISRAN